MTNGFRAAIRAAMFAWECDPRVVPALLAMLHNQAETLPVQFNAVGVLGDGDPDHLRGCPEVGIAHVRQWQGADDDGCRISYLRALLTCPHTRGWADYAELGGLLKLLEYIEGGIERG
jgi:hypothetical protein